MRVLVLNAGSSSLKASVLESHDLRTVARVELSLGADATRREDLQRGVGDVLARIDRQVDIATTVQAVGHRVVHGGTRFRAAAKIDNGVLREIENLAEFAPLHNRVAADTIRAAQSAVPGIPHLAVFDTAFHATLAEEAFVYPVPWEWYERWGIRRFGFHGLSVTWSLERAAALLQRPSADLGLIVAHLGSGCSVTAVWQGKSIETSMGLTPMEGLMMGTRGGSIDPGILLHLQRTGRSDWRELDEALNHHAGLVGVSGRSAGMRELEQAAGSGDDRARLAVTMFVRRAAAGIAAIATALPRLDALVFTGGIGEHSGSARSAIVSRLGLLGIPPISDAAVTDDGMLSAAGSMPAVLRIEAREDAVVARQVAGVLQSPSPSGGG